MPPWLPPSPIAPPIPWCPPTSVLTAVPTVTFGWISAGMAQLGGGADPTAGATATGGNRGVGAERRGGPHQPSSAGLADPYLPNL
jgi:hypothetical protein